MDRKAAAEQYYLGHRGQTMTITRNLELHSEATSRLEVDMAIVGAGVSGLYSGWRLLTSPNRPQSIHIFDLSDRIGGRLESVVLPGMKISGELGGMRYMTQQEIVTTLIERIFSLPAIDFPMGDPSTHFFYMRTQRLRADAWEKAQKSGTKLQTNFFLRPDSEGFNADQLFNKIVYDVLVGDPWFVKNYGNKVSKTGVYEYDFKLTARDWDVIKPALKYCFPGPYEGMRVNDMGFWNLIKDQEGEEAYSFLAVAGGYYSNTINWNAAEAFPYMVGDFSNVGTRYKTIDGGYDLIAYALAEAYLNQKGSKIWSQNRLVNFERSGGPRRYKLFILNLRSRKTWVVDSDAIILAMPRRSLELLNQFNFFFDPDRQSKRQSEIAAVIMEPSFKLLMGFEQPWWKAFFGAIAGESITDLPVRQCYYFGTDPKDSHSLFLASYNDMETVPFWSVLQEKDLSQWRPAGSTQEHFAARSLEPLKWKSLPKWKVTETAFASQASLNVFQDNQAPAPMVREAMAQIRELHDIKQIPDPYITYFKDWTQDPYGGGYHAWKAGVDVANVMRYMRRPDASEAIHVCGEAYSDQQGWVEGALCVAERMLQEYFGLPWPSWLNPDYYLGW